MKFGYISDIHGNHYTDIQTVLNNLKPEEPVEYLIIAGDLSNENVTSLEILEHFSKQYKKVFFVEGNHEHYNFSEWSALERYLGYRLKEEENLRYYHLKELIKKKFTNVQVLSSETGVIEVEGIKIAGACMWYNVTRENLVVYQQQMNDSKVITLEDVRNWNKRDKVFYNSVIEEVDIFVSHIPLNKTSNYSKYSNNAFFINKRRKYPNKIYVAGHSHVQEGYKDKGSYFLFNTLGYPSETELDKTTIKIFNTKTLIGKNNF